MSRKPPPDKPLTRWKQFRYRIEWLALTAAAAAVRNLPYDSIEPLSSLLGRIVFHLDARGRSVALENLRVALGNEFSPEQREVIACKSYENFARTMLCLFWSPNLTRENYRDFLIVDGLDSDPAHLDPKQCGVYFLGHFSNFEWLALFTAYAVSPGIIIAQSFKNPLLNPIFDAVRSVTGHQVISRDRALIRMLKFVRQGGKVGAAADLSVDPRLGAIPIRCFGLWTAGSPMAALLSSRENAPLFLTEIFPTSEGKFRLIMNPRLEVPANASQQEITQHCWDALEPLIRANPELWLWNYKHWRFRPSDADPADYPAYSHTTPRFDNMLRDLA